MSTQEEYLEYMSKVKSSFNEAKANIENVFNDIKDKGYSEHELEFQIKMRLDDVCSDFVAYYAMTFGGSTIKDETLRIKSMEETKYLVQEIVDYPFNISRSFLNPSNKSI